MSFLKAAKVKAEQMRKPPEVAFVQVDRSSLKSDDPQKKSYSFSASILNKTKGSSLEKGKKTLVTVKEQKLEDLEQGLLTNGIGKKDASFNLFLESVSTDDKGNVEARYAKVAESMFDGDTPNKGRVVNVKEGQDFGTVMRSPLSVVVTTPDRKRHTATGASAIRNLLSKEEIMSVVNARSQAINAGDKEGASRHPVSAYSRVIFPDEAIAATSENLGQVLADLYANGIDSAIVRQAIPTDEGVRILPMTVSLRELGDVDEEDRADKAIAICTTTVASLINRGMSNAFDIIEKNEDSVKMDVIPSRVDRVMDHPTTSSKSQLFGLIDDYSGTSFSEKKNHKPLSDSAIKMLDGVYPQSGYGYDASVISALKRDDGSVVYSHALESSVVIDYNGVRIHNIPTSVLSAEVVSEAKAFSRDPKPESKDEQKADVAAVQAPVSQAPIEHEAVEQKAMGQATQDESVALDFTQEEINPFEQIDELGN